MAAFSIPTLPLSGLPAFRSESEGSAPSLLPILDFEDLGKSFGTTCLTPGGRTTLQELNEFILVHCADRRPAADLKTAFFERRFSTAIKSIQGSLSYLGEMGKKLSNLIAKMELEGKSASTILLKIQTTTLGKLQSAPEAADREKLQQLLDLVVEFRKRQEAMSQLPLLGWINLAQGTSPSTASPVQFFGEFRGVPAPEGIESTLWPPSQALWHTYEELKRSFLGGETNVIQRESIRLEGDFPIEITGLFHKDEQDLVRVESSDDFFTELILRLSRWVSPEKELKKEEIATLIAQLKEINVTPLSPLERGRLSHMLAAADLSKEISEERVRALVHLMRMNSLIKRYPIVALIGASTINAAAEIALVKQHYLHELFCRGVDEEKKHLYCSNQDHPSGTHLKFELPNRTNRRYRVTQITQYNVHAHPKRTVDGLFGPILATFKVHWTIGISKKSESEPRLLELQARELTFHDEASLEDRQLLPFLFRQAQHRYSKREETSEST